MSENKQFKIGGEAWYFTFPEDGCGGFDVSSIELNQITVNEFLSKQPFLKYAFVSKELALIAMKEKIIGLGGRE